MRTTSHFLFRVLLGSVAVVYLLAVLGGVFGGDGVNEVDEERVVRPVQVEAGAGQREKPWVGFAISFHHCEDVGPYLRAVDELVRVGVNSVEIVTPAYQKDGAAEEVYIDEERGAKREHVAELLRYIKSKGMTASLMPIVLLSSPRGNEWRGKIHPENWERWWESYGRVIDHFVGIAKEGGADAFCVGSELLSTEKDTKRWVSLIGGVREKFGGRLYYSTNWDHYHVPAYWSYVDMIGVSCYWDMTSNAKGGEATDESLAERWREIRGQLVAFGKHQGRPVLLTELGYPSLPWGLKDPWNYVNSKSVKAAHGVQAAGYRAFIAAWGDLLGPGREAAEDSPMAGVYFYSWEPWGDGGEDDTGYGVRGKPAYGEVKRWLVGGEEGR